VVRQDKAEVGHAVRFLLVFLVEHPRPARRGRAQAGDRHLKITNRGDNLRGLRRAGIPRPSWTLALDWEEGMGYFT
jgi:hypothetical protein